MVSYAFVDLTGSDDEVQPVRATTTKPTTTPITPSAQASSASQPVRVLLRLNNKNQSVPKAPSPLPVKSPNQQSPAKNVQVRGPDGRFTASPRNSRPTQAPSAVSAVSAVLTVSDSKRRKAQSALREIWLNDNYGLPWGYTSTLISTETLTLYADLCETAKSSALGKDILWAREGVFPAVVQQYPRFQFHTALMESARGRLNYLLAKRQATKSDGPHKSLKARICHSCADLGVACDGGEPCNPCSEPGIDCVYDTLIGKPSQKSQTTAPVLNTQLPTSTDLNPRSDPAQPQPRANNLMLKAQEAGKTAENKAESVKNVSKTTFLHVAEEVSQSELGSDSEGDHMIHLEPDIEQISVFVKKEAQDMQSTREYLVQPILRQARIDAKNAPFPQLRLDLPDPFSKLVSKVKSAKTEMHSGSSSKDSVPLQSKDHRQGTQSKVVSRIHVPTGTYRSEAVMLPKYKSIGRVGPSILARNVRTLKYWPYSPDDERLTDDNLLVEKYKEHQERYTHNDASLKAQRKCAEIVGRWKPTIDSMLEDMDITYFDILYYLLRPAHEPWTPHMNISAASVESWKLGKQDSSCYSCQADLKYALGSRSISAFNRLPVPQDRALAMAGLACATIQKESRVSLWHAAMLDTRVKEFYANLDEHPKRTSTLCMVCCLHNCPTHGSYRDPLQNGYRQTGRVTINDPEDEANQRHSIVLPQRTVQPGERHQCSFYCLPSSTPTTDILGRHANGVIRGEYSHSAKDSSTYFNDNITCGKACFWDVASRPVTKGVLDQEVDLSRLLGSQRVKLFIKLLPTYSKNKRGPCLMRQIFKEVTCTQIFLYMLVSLRKEHKAHEELTRKGDIIQQEQRKEKNPRPQSGWENNAALDERPPFVPCSHPGPCQDNDKCSCWRDKVACEYICGCDTSCGQRWRGCDCSGSGKACFEDEARCPCWKAHRECDPWLCGTCGVLEVLDPQNRFNDQIRIGRCRNNRLQLDLPARTVKAPSEVQGWGLYSGEDLKKGTYIGEYRGEVVSTGESDRRGAVYSNLGQEYLFKMNRDQEIDASNIGNKMRFMNNSVLDNNINVVPKKLLCNGEQRVMIYARRDIKAGEELLYNYNYPPEVSKHFWERGQGPLDRAGTVVKNAPSKDRRYLAKSSGNRNDDDGDTDSGQQRRIRRTEKKRKRSSATIDHPSESGQPRAPVQSGMVMEETAEKFARGPVIEASDESEYDEVDGEASDVSSTSNAAEEDEELDSDSEDGSSGIDSASVDPSSFRKRRIRPGDRRVGGKAQREGWNTRKSRVALGRTYQRMPRT